jgi:hypothetical protein
LNPIRQRTSVLSGTAVGLIAGAAVYAVVSSSAVATLPRTFRGAKAQVAAGPARAADCARGQKLEKVFCVIHVVRTVVVAP